ncbi:hypothetical protein L249_7186 [Ophiocordyceps polyrhachis-furcata BCC 54312]|uniref:Peptidyl-prolyl cis-trans isomerase n=1 Tax=Ophiocordyceps polyrhachis-furcata BCC 54312 TaxID=1330021 RepID=A0A367L9I3_9HYPO|nr:hypothetical protein L249_7186 [Ophiocordyceps polyrhachis-furcata BCC 54312]
MGKSTKKDEGKKDEAKANKAGARSINVRHILCEKHAKKEEALAKINDGIKFDENKGSLDPQFEEVAFALEPSTTASPKIGEVKTGFGYHIIMVGRPICNHADDRLLSDC